MVTERSATFAKRVILRDKRCVICGTVENLYAHHIVPLSFGGADHPDNGETLCRDCHIKKHRELPRKFHSVPKDKRLSERMCIMLSPKDYERVISYANKHRRKPSTMARDMILDWLDTKEAAKAVERNAPDGAEEE